MGRASPMLYRLGWLVGRGTFFCTMNLRVLRPRVAARGGPYVLACTHLSNLEPFVVGLAMRRKIDFIARKEFYRYRLMAWGLRALDAIRVDRQGVPVSTIRTGLDRLRRGRIVGIFPEGGVSRGRASACVGGPIRLGACLLACRGNVPIVPCVVVGTHELNRVKPWLPFKRARAWVAFGEPILPIGPGRTIAERRVAYRQVGEQLRAAFQSLYQELCTTYELGDQAGETYAEAATASGPVVVQTFQPAQTDTRAGWKACTTTTACTAMSASADRPRHSPAAE